MRGPLRSRRRRGSSGRSVQCVVVLWPAAQPLSSRSCARCSSRVRESPTRACAAASSLSPVCRVSFLRDKQARSAEPRCCRRKMSRPSRLDEEEETRRSSSLSKLQPPRARHVLRRCSRHALSSAAHHSPLDPRRPRGVSPLWSVDPARRLAAPSSTRPAPAAAHARRQSRRCEQGPVERGPEQAHEERRRGLGRRHHADGRRRGGPVAAAAGQGQ